MSKSYRQKWACKTCGKTYEAPLPVAEVLCSTSHFVNKRHMVLVEGDPVSERKSKTTKKVASDG